MTAYKEETDLMLNEKYKIDDNQIQKYIIDVISNNKTIYK